MGESNGGRTNADGVGPAEWTGDPRRTRRPIRSLALAGCLIAIGAVAFGIVLEADSQIDPSATADHPVHAASQIHSAHSVRSEATAKRTRVQLSVVGQPRSARSKTALTTSQPRSAASTGIAGSRAAAPQRPSAVPATLQNGSLIYLGLLSFTDPVEAPDSDVVVVTAGNRSIVDVCRPTSMGFVVSESDSVVQAVVAQYGPSAPATYSCPTGTEPNTVTIRLARPLGNRSVIDATSDWLVPSVLPREFDTASSLRAAGEATIRTFSGGPRSYLSIEAGPGAFTVRVQTLVTGTADSSQVRKGAATIHGHPATLVEQLEHAVNPTRCLVWQESPTSYLTVCAGGSGQAMPTVAELVRIAQSIPVLGR